MSYTCTWQFDIAPDGETDVPAEVDRLMQELLNLEACNPVLADSGVGLDLSAMTVEVTLSIHCENIDEALHEATSAIRTAIHAAGGGTPGWPDATPSTGGRVAFHHRELTTV